VPRKSKDSYSRFSRHPFQPARERNAAGPTIRKLRNDRGFSQAELAAKLQRNGWDASREMVAKIESQQREISDLELLLLCRVLTVTPNQLLSDRTP
jgi:transcriptional regulator with XRE-family HTH domain